jgi:hypothetical protein
MMAGESVYINQGNVVMAALVAVRDDGTAELACGHDAILPVATEEQVRQYRGMVEDTPGMLTASCAACTDRLAMWGTVRPPAGIGPRRCPVCGVNPAGDGTITDYCAYCVGLLRSIHGEKVCATVGCPHARDVSGRYGPHCAFKHRLQERIVEDRAAVERGEIL